MEGGRLGLGVGPRVERGLKRGPLTFEPSSVSQTFTLSAPESSLSWSVRVVFPTSIPGFFSRRTLRQVTTRSPWGPYAPEVDRSTPQTPVAVRETQVTTSSCVSTRGSGKEGEDTHVCRAGEREGLGLEGKQVGTSDYTGVEKGEDRKGVGTSISLGIRKVSKEVDLRPTGRDGVTLPSKEWVERRGGPF